MKGLKPSKYEHKLKNKPEEPKNIEAKRRQTRAKKPNTRLKRTKKNILLHKTTQPNETKTPIENDKTEITDAPHQPSNLTFQYLKRALLKRIYTQAQLENEPNTSQKRIKTPQETEQTT